MHGNFKNLCTIIYVQNGLSIYFVTSYYKKYKNRRAKYFYGNDKITYDTRISYFKPEDVFTDREKEIDVLFYFCVIYVLVFLRIKKLRYICKTQLEQNHLIFFYT